MSDLVDHLARDRPRREAERDARLIAAMDRLMSDGERRRRDDDEGVLSSDERVEYRALLYRLGRPPASLARRARLPALLWCIPWGVALVGLFATLVSSVISESPAPPFRLPLVLAAVAVLVGGGILIARVAARGLRDAVTAYEASCHADLVEFSRRTGFVERRLDAERDDRRVEELLRAEGRPPRTRSF
jgi:hypothetical protein